MTVAEGRDITWAEAWDELGPIHLCDGEPVCVCGHEVEEHEPIGGGAGRCEIQGCPCARFHLEPTPTHPGRSTP